MAVVPALLVLIGLSGFHSIPMAVFLYHGYCLINIVLSGRQIGKQGFPSLLEFLIAGACGVILSLLSVGLWRLTGDLIADPDICRTRIEGFGLPIDRWGLFAAYFLLVNPVIEELYWRGCVQERAREIGILRDAFVAVPFSLWHIVTIWAVCGPIAAALGGVAVYCVGVLLTMMYRQSRSLGRCIVWHAMMADLAVISLMFACR
jgi:membrane protease YdiL (CAAX protease family)